jgi:hypothetical protein
MIDNDSGQRGGQEPPTPSATVAIPRWVWVILFLLMSALVGGVSGLLSHAAGSNVPASILTGGAAFAGTVGLLVALAHYADGA